MPKSKNHEDVAAGAEVEEREEFRIFYDHIKRAGLKKTGQRDMILDVFLRTEGKEASA